MVVLPPFGAAVAACSVVNRRNEEEEKKRKEKLARQSVFTVTVDDENINIKNHVVDDFDWVRAAYGLIKACQEKGLAGQLAQVLNEEGGNGYAE